MAKLMREYEQLEVDIDSLNLEKDLLGTGLAVESIRCGQQEIAKQGSSPRKEAKVNFNLPLVEQRAGTSKIVPEERLQAQMLGNTQKK
ncbi:unnamed protein product, partial [Mesorhabditis spiculigera]